MVRIKERYLLVNIIYPPDQTKAKQAGVPFQVVQHQPTTDWLTPGALIKVIKTEVASLFGDYGAGAMEGDLTVKYLSLATSTLIIRCSRAHYQMLWAALTFMDHVPTKDGRGRPCIYRVVRVSGTIRKAEEEAIRQAKQLILAAREQADAGSAFLSSGPAAPAVENMMDVDVADDSDDEAMNDSEG